MRLLHLKQLHENWTIAIAHNFAPPYFNPGAIWLFHGHNEHWVWNTAVEKSPDKESNMTRPDFEKVSKSTKLSHFTELG
jgi:hypothetical protein